MGLPIITALFALGVGLSLVTLGTHVFDTAELRAAAGGDDRARRRDRLRALHPHPLPQRARRRPRAAATAAIAAVDTAGRAVLFAGITVIISLMGMLLLGISFLYGVAMAAALAVLFTMIAALTLLPALLTIAGRRVDRLRIPGLGKRSTSIDENSRWFRWSREIQRRPGARGAALRRRCCWPSASRPSRCGSAPTTPAPTRRGRRRARPTTCSPKASAPASTGPSRWSRRCRARAKTQG